MNDLDIFLKLVAEGEQDQAEAMLKVHKNLALGTGDVTDLSKRTFKGITAFQYAVWALDWHMWTMLRKYLPDEAVRVQIQSMTTGSWISQHGKSASWQDLLDALQEYIDLCNKCKETEAWTHWLKQVGGAQRLLPAHVINEYCHPSRPFEPCPDFTSQAPLPRTRQLNEGEWFTKIHKNGKIGETFGVLRSSYSAMATAGGGAVVANGDHKACHTLLVTRAQQRDQLLAQYSPSPLALKTAPAAAPQPAQTPTPLAHSSVVAPVPSQHLEVLPLTTDKTLQVKDNAVEQLLKFVTEGEQDEAEKMLQGDRNLALVVGDVTDLSKRTFKNITAFQYAVWALDWHMWTMIRKYLSDDIAREQIQGMTTGSWVSRHGSHANWDNLTNALKTLLDNWPSWSASQVNQHWVQQVGTAQLILPAHVANEYCHPSRLFSPCPDFTKPEPNGIWRTRQTPQGEWFTSQYNGGKFAVARGTNAVASVYGDWVWNAKHIILVTLRDDQAAVKALYDTRVKQRADLVAELKSVKSFERLKISEPIGQNEDISTVASSSKASYVVPASPYVIPPTAPTSKEKPGDIKISFSIPYEELKFGPLKGKGGFGEVYAGTWRDHVDVAIKKLLVTRFSDEVLAEFQHEIAVMARLRSPQIVQLYGACMQEPYCIVMEYMVKGSLYHVLRAERLNWPQKEQIALDMSCGLAFLHHENIIHRDMKSLNVLVDGQLRAKLSDFGLAKIKENSLTTVKGSAAGTMLWMAPELFKPKASCTKGSDVYSLGVTLWELASGEVPYALARTREDSDAEQIPSDTPPAVAKLITFCWDARAEKRPTANQAVELLKEARAGLK